MKILNVTPMYLPVNGGGERHAREVSEWLVSRGHEVTVLTANVDSHENLWPGRWGNLPAAEVVNGVKVVRFSPEGGWVGAGLGCGVTEDTQRQWNI